jgi:hypothetical protein
MKRTGAVVVSGVLLLLEGCSSERVYGGCEDATCGEGGQAGDSNGSGKETGGSAGASGASGSSASAGEGAGGDTEPAKALMVLSVSPEDGATGVATEETTVSATFSQALDAETVTSKSFAVSVRGNAVAGELEVDGDTVTFSPGAPLALLSVYEVALAGSIADEGGNQLSKSPYAWSFSTADGAWRGWQEIELDPNDARESKVAVDALGNAIVVWRAQNPDSAYDVWATRYDIETGWGEPTMLDVEEGSTYYPQIAMDSQGNAVAVWHQMVEGQTLFQVWAATFSPDDGWADPHVVKPATEHSTYFDTAAVAFDERGHAIVAWSESDGTSVSSTRIWANRLTWSNRDNVSGGWGNAAKIDPNLVNYRSKVRVQMDSEGSAVVTWQQTEAAGSSVWANRFDSKGGWAGAKKLHSDGSGLYNAALAGNRRGDAVALATTNDRLLAFYFVPGQGWDEEPTPIGEPGLATGPVAGMDDEGNVIAAWVGGEDLWASRYVPGVGWGDPEKIDAKGAKGVNQVVSVDPSGNAIVVWGQTGGTFFNRFSVLDGWSGPAALSSEDNPSGFDFAIAASESGRVAMSWQVGFSIAGAVFR